MRLPGCCRCDEGEELRKEGISIPLIVMNPEFSSFNVLFENQLEPEVYSFRLLDAMIKETERRGITSYPIHIKIDTGMQPFRLPAGRCTGGLPSPERTERRSSSLRILTSRRQRLLYLRRFHKKATGYVHPRGSRTGSRVGIQGDQAYPELGRNRTVHRLSDGYGTSRHRLYGVSASGQKGLRNISTLKTTILQIQNVPAGDSIGYSRMSYVKRDSRIAIIPIGYADGLDRHFSNGGGEVVINGHRCPIIGNICMDACMIDVTDTDAHEGDSVIIFGEELPVCELSDKLKTIPYEILTSISPRVKRVYYRE